MKQHTEWLDKMKRVHPGWNVWDKLIDVMSNREAITLHADKEQEYLVNKEARISVRIDAAQSLEDSPQLPAWVEPIVGLDCSTPGPGFNTSGRLFGNYFRPLRYKDFNSFFVRADPPKSALDGLTLYHMQYNRSGMDLFYQSSLKEGASPIATPGTVRIYDRTTREFAALGSLENFARYSMAFTLRGDHWHFSYRQDQPELGAYELTFVDFS